MKNLKKNLGVIQDALADVMMKHEDGQITALDAAIEVNSLQSSFEDMVKHCKEWRSENHDEIERETIGIAPIYKGHTIKVNSGRKMFDFKAIPEWISGKSNLSLIEAKYKSAYDNYQKNVASVEQDTGEVLQLPVVTFTRPSITIKKAK